MAGHSKYKNIMYRKGAQDKKRSSLFSKLSREITVAARSGLRTSEETFAASAVGLAFFGTGAGEPDAGAGPAAVLAGAFLAAYLSARSTRTWLLASWGMLQLAVLHLLTVITTRL